VTVRSTVVVVHPIPVSQAVKMFIRNFHTLRANLGVRDDYDAFDAMAQGLRNLRQAPPTDRIVWDMRVKSCWSANPS
jgi:hypothetical protein